MTGLRFRIDSDIARQAALSARIARGQSDISSQSRLQVASDDPAAAARISELRKVQANETAWRANVEVGAAAAARADGVLQSVATLLDRARELVTLAANDTLGASDRSTIAAELRGLADEVDSLAATTDATGQPVFPANPLRIPVDTGLTLTATASLASVFQVASRSLGTLLRDAATGVTGTAATRAMAMADVGLATDQISSVRGEQGSRAARIDALRERLIDAAATVAEERSGLADTDIAATIARIQGDQLALDAAQAAFARINRRTLFDLLA